MKKIRMTALLALLVLVSLATSSVYAQDNLRYKRFHDGGTIQYFFDTATIRYRPDPYRNELLIDVWVKAMSTDVEESTIDHTLNRYYIRLKERQIMLITEIEYAKDGSMCANKKHKYKPENWTEVIPNTLADYLYIAVTEYAKINDETLREQLKER